MRPELIHIGDFTLYSFGLMAALALIVPGIAVVYPLLRRRGVVPDFAFELIFAAGIGGFFGARLYYMAEHWSTVREDVWGALTSGYGFTWYGGLMGGFVAVVLWCLVRKVPTGIVANAMGPAVALGYAIGRVGCQLAGDGDYGTPSDLPWAMGYPNGTVPTPPGVRVHPTPIYEIIMMVPIIWVLWRLAKKDRSGWWTFGWMLVLTGIERFVVEFVRRNEEIALGLTQPQWVAIASVVIGTGLVLLFRGRPAERIVGAQRRS
ncbi:MAG TPA: prolipoprotein diacylglyceryl transferase [Thermoleophilia bacterium]|nr:prolipoprotein diacylglyceryl transferase [Thermoleophilia bacterium]HQG03689.1 prolipoprotein diacylglyceryl transferase [Thermoleophilia bacterium]HQG54391.1 prolipoprotein diacylglyceryl transferase [Thermoleophilia bacterium]HQJ97938.1 prolipoprotein diacylglyceryl transferase [Thermoleophilia bacterium]